MRISKLFYLLSFFAPIAFLLGFIAGAPRPVNEKIHLEQIDTRTLPVTGVDLYMHQDSMVVEDVKGLQPNSEIEPR